MMYRRIQGLGLIPSSIYANIIPRQVLSRQCCCALNPRRVPDPLPEFCPSSSVVEIIESVFSSLVFEVDILRLQGGKGRPHIPQAHQSPL